MLIQTTALCRMAGGRCVIKMAAGFNWRLKAYIIFYKYKICGLQPLILCANMHLPRNSSRRDIFVDFEPKNVRNGDGVRVAVGAAVMALVHSPVVPGCASKHERRAIVIDGENSCLSLSHTSPYCPLSLAIFQEVTPLGESSIPWTKTATKPSASASKWNWDSVSIWLWADEVQPWKSRRRGTEAWMQ